MDNPPGLFETQFFEKNKWTKAYWEREGNAPKCFQVEKNLAEDEDSGP